MSIAGSQVTEFAHPTEAAAEAVSRTTRRRWLRLLVRDSGAITGAVIVSVVVVLAVVGPALTGHDAARVDPMNRLLPPSSQHWIGTDTFGRDVLTRMLYGARVSLLVGLATMVITAILGALLGLVAGYVHAADGPIMRVMDGFMAFPSLLLAIAIMAALGAHTENVIVALSVGGALAIRHARVGHCGDGARAEPAGRWPSRLPRPPDARGVMDLTVQRESSRAPVAVAAPAGR